jgi:lariat debranching enzyme
MHDFYRYYSGERAAPVLTLFVGGNHEAANHLQELWYGGWVAPNIYYMGNAGVVRFKGLRIGGLSGIYKEYDFQRGFTERPPYDSAAERSAFHTREYDVFRLMHLAQAARTGQWTWMQPPPPPSGAYNAAGTALPSASSSSSGGGASDSAPYERLDIMISHDWPAGIYHYGDTAALLRRKRHFADDVSRGALGSPASLALLRELRPRLWVAGHLHTRFEAAYPHPSSAAALASENGPSASASQTPPQTTRFLALDKCLPGRAYLEVIDMPLQSGAPPGSAAGSEETETSDVSGGNAAAASEIDISDVLDAGALAAVQAASTEAITEAQGSTGSDLEYDLEWLAVVRQAHPLLPLTRRYPPLPAAVAVSGDDRGWVARQLMVSQGSFSVPRDAFQGTVPPYDPHNHRPAARVAPPAQQGNPQTDRLLALLDLAHTHQLTVPYTTSAAGGNSKDSDNNNRTASTRSRWGQPHCTVPSSSSLLPSLSTGIDRAAILSEEHTCSSVVSNSTDSFPPQDSNPSGEIASWTDPDAIDIS